MTDAVITCTACEGTIERCEVCERPDCDAAQCLRCSDLDLGQRARILHVHGG